MKVGIISDTHGYIHKGVTEFLKPCDEIWHCGDIGSMEIIEHFQSIAPIRAVYGNIDGGVLRKVFTEFQLFQTAGIKVLMTHIGGYPGKYAPGIEQMIKKERPFIFICGHSHILKVMFDKKNQCLHINPGAAGKYGFHPMITAIRLDINNQKPENLEVYEFTK